MARLTLVRRREVWVPTWQGALLLAGFPAIGLALALWMAYPLLSVNNPNGRGILVVEGWMSKSQMLSTAALLEGGQYSDLVVTGGPVSHESYLRELYPSLDTFAEIGAHQLRQAGVAEAVAVPRPDVGKDRTYASGLAVRKWLLDNGRAGVTIDLVSVGPHARRSRLLFSSALDGVADVGVIALPPTGYDPGRWWTTSQGVRSMIGELLAYGYATILFWPDPEHDFRELYKEGIR